MERLQRGARRPGCLRPCGPGSCFFVCTFSGLLLALMAIVAVHKLVTAAAGLSSCSIRGSFLVVVRGLLITMASLVGSVLAAQGFGCPKARGIFPDRESNLCPLLWRAYS